MRVLFLILLLTGILPQPSIAQPAPGADTAVQVNEPKGKASDEFKDVTATGNKPWDNSIIEQLKKDGRIYIVIVVIGIILLGLFYYMLRLERKIGRLENQLRK
jgi:hypothetical protein